MEYIPGDYYVLDAKYKGVSKQIDTIILETCAGKPMKLKVIEPEEWMRRLGFIIETSEPDARDFDDDCTLVADAFNFCLS